MADIPLNECCYRLNHLDRSWDIDVYMANGGYEIWKKVLGQIGFAHIEG